jgi:membrane associated rhomboid family serine protease
MIPLRDNITRKTRPVINWVLILANCYVFYVEMHFSNPALFEKWAMHWAVVPSRFWNSPLTQMYSLLTAAFMHGGWGHIIGNMLFLYVFGPSVEDRMGHLRYFLFYLAIGMFANAAQAYTAPMSHLPLIGASGAIAGVLGSYFFYYPYARILTLIPFWIFSRILEIPAFLFLGLWFVMQAFAGAKTLSIGIRSAQDVGGVAWWAHSAGFVGGLLLGPALARKRPKIKVG